MLHKFSNIDPSLLLCLKDLGQADGICISAQHLTLLVLSHPPLPTSYIIPLHSLKKN